LLRIALDATLQAASGIAGSAAVALSGSHGRRTGTIAFDGEHACGDCKPKRCAGRKAITAPRAERTAAGATPRAGPRWFVPDRGTAVPARMLSVGASDWSTTVGGIASFDRHPGTGGPGSRGFRVEWEPAFRRGAQLFGQRFLPPRRLSRRGTAISRSGLLELGRLVGRARFACEAMGFPWAQVHEHERGPRRGAERIVGKLDQLSGIIPGERTGVVAVHVDGGVPLARNDGGSPWEGMSGSVLVAGSLVVAVVIVDSARFGPDRLGAVLVTAVASDPALADVLARKGISPVPRAVEAQGVLQAPSSRRRRGRLPTAGGRRRSEHQSLVAVRDGSRAVPRARGRT
jgi:hypothetical protein